MCKYPFATAYVPAARPVPLSRGDIAEGRFAKNRDPNPHGSPPRFAPTVRRHGLPLKLSSYRKPTEIYALERVSEDGSAPIRSAVKFYFGIDVRTVSQLFLKNIFFRTSKQFFEKSTILDKN